jgi:hypothetical protein
MGHLFPGAIVSHRSALQGGPNAEGELFLTYSYTRKIKLPGLTIRLLEGPKPTPEDPVFMQNLYRSSDARALLENLQPSRSRTTVSKCLPQTEIENYLDKICRIHGPIALNKIRDQANKIAELLHMQTEFKLLNQIISAILGTHDVKDTLTSPAALASAAGKPYDSYRVQLFQTLFAALYRCVFVKRSANIHNPSSWKTLAFFDAYFSNYIEGTQFAIEEAEQIIFDNQIIEQRSSDSHDIRGTYEVLVNRKQMQQSLQSFLHFIELLKTRHNNIMFGRPTINPGQFKVAVNRAGNTEFVAPELVLGTLEQGFNYLQQLTDPLARAMFMMFLITEVHPFSDGNGRIARIMMNAELAHGQCSHIIIPTVFRENYILALRALSRQHRCSPYIKMLDKAQAFVTCLDFSDYNTTKQQLIQANAFQEPEEAMLRFPQGIMPIYSDISE